VASLAGSVPDKAWKYLESVLEEYEKPDDYTLRRVALENLLQAGGPELVPTGLTRSIWVRTIA
jgi:hypothetical protein